MKKFFLQILRRSCLLMFILLTIFFNFPSHIVLEEISDFFCISLLVAVETFDVAAACRVPGKLGTLFFIIKLYGLLIRYESVIFRMDKKYRLFNLINHSYR